MTLTKTTNYMPITKVKKKNFAICMWRFMFGSCNLDWSIFQVISMLTYLLKCVTLSIYSNLKKKISPKRWLSKSSLCILLKNVHGLHLANGIGERNGYTKSDFRARLESAERIGLTRFFFIFFCQILAIFDDFLMFLRYHF